MNIQKHVVVGLILMALLAGCTSDWDPGRLSSRAEPSRSADHLAAAAPAFRPRVAVFAALPDRGELLAYDRSRAVRQRGAYTSHPIRLSEAHAFRATQAGGELVVAAPDGELIRLAYESHIEHPDGNWTWIGRNANGDDAVLTFGEKAVFGTVPYRDQEPLRITTMAGGAWLVATDRNKLPRDINRATTRTGKPDYLIPPDLSATLSSSTSAMAAQDVTTKSAATTIDVVLGYTNGYATQLGGASQAVTRLNNLVQVANQAMTNSKIFARRLRLVRTVQVNYFDATSNETALEQLTGYRVGTGEIPVPAALQPLRNARDQYGGDLVALVRPFRSPENDGCGIAWLIGGGQTPFTTDAAPFGYSVVSDGTDFDESDNNTYLCREESLAHELGHNMGQAHDVDNSNQSGVHAYSYGYRESSGTGFFTVMAYALGDGQAAIRHFANPAVTYAGRHTGVANAADNARSMASTMPVVAGFRASVVPDARVTRDIDGDGNSDVLLYNGSSNRFAWWRMSGTNIVQGLEVPSGAGYAPVGVGDFNGDRRSDNIWFQSSNRILLVQVGTGSSFSNVYQTSLGAGWVPVGAADVTGDGKSDLLMFNPTLRQLHYRAMNGGTVLSSQTISGLGAGYTPAGYGDVNADGKADILWTSSARDLYVWASNGTTFVSQKVADYSASYNVIGMADVDGDGRSDILFHNPSAGVLLYLRMQGFSILGTHLVGGVGAGFSVAAFGDYNGDGKADIAWHNPSTRQVHTWIGNGSTFLSAYTGTYPAGYVPAPPAKR